MDGIAAALQAPSRGKDELNYRKNLYVALERLGPSCKSPANFERLKRLRDHDLASPHQDIREAAQRAYAAMDPR